MNSAGESPIRIYLLTQNRLAREAIARLFRRRAGLLVMGEGQDCAEGMDGLAEIPCDVLLLDSLETLQVVKERARATGWLVNTKIVLYGMDEDKEHFLKAVRGGVCGYLPYDASSAEIIDAVRAVAKGEAICPRKLCKTLFEQISIGFPPQSGKAERDGHATSGLTCRQRQLMSLVAKGMTNKEIAASLQLSEFTIKNHIHRIMSHLQANSRHEAVDVIRTGGFFLSAEERGGKEIVLRRT